MTNAKYLLPTALATALALMGCAGISAPPQQDLPAAQSEATSPLVEEWWRNFNDPTLTALVQEALSHNANVLTAAQNVTQSESTLREATVALLPQAGLNGSVARQKPSQQTAPPSQSSTVTIYQANVAASYEVDLWGRLWKARDAAKAQLAASEYAREVARSAVAAQTAKSYFALLGLDADVALLTQTLATRDAALDLQKKRYALGASGELELKQAEAEREAVAAQLPSAMAARTQAEAALSVLLGRSPREVIERDVARGQGLEVLATVPDIPLALPADLLTRRPDVQLAAAQFAQADASLSEARRRFFPDITLSGLFGGQSLSASKLFQSTARTWTAAAAVAQPLVGLASIEAEVEAAKASRKQAEIGYAQAARSAYADAKSALAAHQATTDALDSTAIRAKDENRIRELVNTRYKAGTASYLDLVNAERDRLAAERDHVDALRDRVTALVSVYQALGGGWQAVSLAERMK